MADGEADEGARSFTRMLDGVCWGQTSIELSQDLHELCAKLETLAQRHDTNSKGKMSIEVSITMSPRGEMQIGVASKTNYTKNKPQESAAWMTKGGNVTFDNPRQQTLPLHDVNAPRGAADDHDPDTGEVIKS